MKGHIMHKFILYGCLIVSMVLCGATGQAKNFDDKSGLIQYRAGKISVKSQKTPFLLLIEQISQKANLDVYIVDQVFPEMVHAKLDNLTVEKALRRILKGCNHAIVYHADHKDSDAQDGLGLVPLLPDRASAAVGKPSDMPVGSAKALRYKPSLNATDKTQQLKKHLKKHQNGATNAKNAIFDQESSLDQNSAPEKNSANEDPLYANNTSNIHRITNQNDGTSLGANLPEHANYGDLSDKEMYLLGQIDLLERQIDSGWAQQWYDDTTSTYDPESVPDPFQRLEYLKAELYNAQYEYY